MPQSRRRGWHRKLIGTQPEPVGARRRPSIRHVAKRRCAATRRRQRAAPTKGNPMTVWAASAQEREGARRSTGDNEAKSGRPSSALPSLYVGDFRGSSPPRPRQPCQQRESGPWTESGVEAVFTVGSLVKLTNSRSPTSADDVRVLSVRYVEARGPSGAPACICVVNDYREILVLQPDRLGNIEALISGTASEAGVCQLSRRENRVADPSRGHRAVRQRELDCVDPGASVPNVAHRDAGVGYWLWAARANADLGPIDYAPCHLTRGFMPVDLLPEQAPRGVCEQRLGLGLKRVSC
jgi:hypothetical protein